MGTGITIARVFGISVRLHWTWLIIFILLASNLATDILPLSDLAGGGSPWQGMRMVAAVQKTGTPPVTLEEAFAAYGVAQWPEWEYWLLGAIGSVGLFICVLAHEISHSLVAIRAGIPVEGITLFIFGGVSQLKEEAGSPGDEFRVAFAGPLMSVALGVGCGAMYYLLQDHVPTQTLSLLYYFGLIILMLAAFNLLPGFPLDGGRILRAILWKHYGSLSRATAVAAWWGGAFGLAFIAWGLIEFWYGLRVGVVEWGAVWPVVIGLFLRYAAKASSQQLAAKDAFAGLTVGDVIQTSVVTVDPDVTLDRLVDEYFYKYRFRSFPVLEGDRLAGVISLKDLQAVPRGEWSVRRVREAMHQVREENLVRPNDDLASVFRKMAEEDKGHLPVVDGGRLAGIVTRHDIMTLIQLKTGLGGRGQPGTR